MPCFNDDIHPGGERRLHCNVLLSFVSFVSFASFASFAPLRF
jgi:hypothetical protein